MIEDTLTISALITYINSRLYNDSNLRNVRVTGELGNFSSYKGSGHWYFTLKDATASIRCAMFRGYNSTVDFMPREGEMLVATGNINIYESRGELQLIVTSLQQAGQGNFYIQFEKIKAKLAPLGYFDESRKKPIKQFPEQISVVTGANTAALQDIRITIAKRWPAVRLLEVYAIVQGKEAIKSITEALKTADSQGSDTIILARGGGSVDDLWCFNDEMIAKTIFECKTPVITGIGHEIDFTIADLVADVRAATPTAAAQRATPDQTEVRNTISSQLSLMKTVLERKLQNKMQSLDIADSMLERFRLNISNTVASLHRYRSILYLSLTKMIENQNIRMEHCMDTLNSSLLLRIERAGRELKNITEILNKNVSQHKQRNTDKFLHLNQLLDSLSPLKVIGRGYAVTKQDEKVVRKADDIDMNKELNIRYSDGTIDAMPLRRNKNG